MTAQHTPGPWERPIKALGGEWHVNSPDDQLFVRVLGAPATADANARLIAAAPLMLDALRNALAYLESECPQESTDDCTSCALICYDIRAAIAAATGEDA